MIEIILSALLLTLIQSWLIPMLLNLGNLSFLLSNRDEDFEFSTITKRAQRASTNLYETLPIFITLMLLGVILDVDLTLSGSVDSSPSALLDVLSRRYQNCALGDLGGISRNSDHDGF